MTEKCEGVEAQIQKMSSVVCVWGGGGMKALFSVTNIIHRGLCRLSQEAIGPEGTIVS